jgi:hypothetical protein
MERMSVYWAFSANGFLRPIPRLGPFVTRETEANLARRFRKQGLVSSRKLASIVDSGAKLRAYRSLNSAPSFPMRRTAVSQPSVELSKSYEGARSA